MIPADPGEPNIITGSLEVKRKTANIAGFEDGRGHNQEILVASKSWKRQENAFSPQVSR